MRTSPRGTPADHTWNSEVSSGFALAGFLTLVFVAFTLLAMGPLAKFDAYFTLAPVPEAWTPFLHVLDRIGQRAVCLPVLAVATYVVCRRQRSWRPAVVGAVSVFMLNLIVLLLKLGLGREGPHTVDPSFFNGGMAYPSGHSSNIVLVYGLVAYLVSRYHSPSRRLRVLLWGVVVLLSVTMVITSVSLDWHWFADLVAGLIVGGIVLQLTVTVDHAVPAAEFGQGWRRGLRDLVGETRTGKSQQPRTPV
ncbi:MAG TPA: phosphatase PAP2 family protein [Nocardioidaceae bacterium]|nr:phosphatase PAP2 family protein [Nocardioidaceae bacterium]